MQQSVSHDQMASSDLHLSCFQRVIKNEFNRTRVNNDNHDNGKMYFSLEKHSSENSTAQFYMPRSDASLKIILT